MTRSESVRQAALKADGHRCVISGAQDGLEVHHWKSLGMGGSDELDTLENAVTISSEIHRQVHDGTLRIDEWDRSDSISGLLISDRFVREMSSGEVVLRDEWKRIPKADLWFYQRQRVAHLEQVEARIWGLVQIEETIARDLYELSEGYPLLLKASGMKEDQTFPEYLSSRGVSVGRAVEAVSAYRWVFENGLTWPSGVTADKVDLIRKSVRENQQDWLGQAVDESYSGIREKLIEAGLREASVRWYLFVGNLITKGNRIVRTRQAPKELIDEARKAGERLYRIAKLETLRYERKTGKLVDKRTGEAVSFEDRV